MLPKTILFLVLLIIVTLFEKTIKLEYCKNTLNRLCEVFDTEINNKESQVHWERTKADNIEIYCACNYTININTKVR